MSKLNKWKIIACLIILLALIPNVQFAQSLDTIYLKPNHTLVLIDTMYFGNQDSIVILPDTIKYVVTKTFAGSVKLLQDYYKSIFIDTVGKYKKHKEEFEKANSYYTPYKGRIIRNITIKQVEMFEGRVSDTTKASVSELSKSLNKGHFSTRKWIIRQNIRIKKNSELNPLLVSENERLIRSLPYIEDAKIYVEADSVYIDSVDLIIVTKDKFPLGLSGSFSSFKKFSVEPYTRNALGFGHTIQPALIYDSKGDPSVGYGGEYVIPNFSGWFVRTKFDFENTYKREQYRLNISKPFVTADILYGGGLEYYRLSTEDTFKEYFLPDSVFDTVYHYSMNYYDVWLARSFFLKKGNYSRFINLSARLTKENYISHPEIKADSNYQFHDQNLILFRLTYQHIQYYKTSRLMAFGVTEDVPYGYSFSLLGGYQFNNYYKRPYLGFTVSWTQYFDKIGYFAYQGGAGSFFYNEYFEDFKLGLKIMYYSPYIDLNRFGVRHFASPLAYSIINPRYLQYGNFGTSIRELQQNEIFGLSSLVFRYEPYFYTPYRVLGFQLAFSLFADIGWITDKKYWSGKWEGYAALGLGFHLKNESLTFPTFTVQLGYYPRITDSSNEFQMSYDFRDRELFKNDMLSKPEIYFDY